MLIPALLIIAKPSPDQNVRWDRHLLSPQRVAFAKSQHYIHTTMRQKGIYFMIHKRQDDCYVCISIYG